MPDLEGLDHVALAVTDVGRSVRWYEDVLGLERLHEDEWGDRPAFLAVAGSGVALFRVVGDRPEPRPGPGVLTMRHLAFRAGAGGFRRMRDRLTERGIAFDEQDHRIARSIYFLDPDGHEIEVTTYEPGDAPGG